MMEWANPSSGRLDVKTKAMGDLRPVRFNTPAPWLMTLAPWLPWQEDPADPAHRTKLLDYTPFAAVMWSFFLQEDTIAANEVSMCQHILAPSECCDVLRIFEANGFTHEGSSLATLAIAIRTYATQRYEALAEALDAVGLHAAAKRATVHMPRIGAGLARGNWTKLEQMICRMAVEHRVVVWVYTLGAVEEQAAGAAHQDAESMVIDEREEETVATLQVQHEESGQWLDFERCVRHEVSTISVQAVRALGIRELHVGGKDVLWVRAPEMVTEDTPSIKWSGAARWGGLPLRKPVGEEHASFAGELDSLEMASEEWEDAWWSKQLEKVQHCRLQQRGLQLEGEAEPDFGGILSC